jgi:hypothetical protein
MWRATQLPKIAIGWLSSGDSEEFFGDSEHHLRRLRRCTETLHMSKLRTLRRNHLSGYSRKISENSGLFYRNTLNKISHLLCECKGVSHR